MGGGLCYWHGMLFSVVWGVPIALDILVGVFYGVPLQEGLLISLLWFAQSFCFSPLAWSALAWWNEQLFGLWECLDFAYALLGALLINVAHTAIMSIMGEARVSSSGYGVAVYCFFLVAAC